jgi:hypothetical protein
MSTRAKVRELLARGQVPFDYPVRISPRRISYPYQAYKDQTTQAIESDWMVRASAYRPAPIMSPEELNSQAYLMEETVPREAGAGIVVFTRRYSMVPAASHVSWSSVAIRFPGYAQFGGVWWYRYGFRAPKSAVVAARVTSDYFVTTAPESIELQKAFAPTLDGEEVDWVGNGSGGFGVAATVPTLTAYTALVTAGTFIAAMDDQLQHLWGDVYRRDRFEARAR